MLAAVALAAQSRGLFEVSNKMRIGLKNPRPAGAL